MNKPLLIALFLIGIMAGALFIQFLVSDAVGSQAVNLEELELIGRRMAGGGGEITISMNEVFVSLEHREDGFRQYITAHVKVLPDGKLIFYQWDLIQEIWNRNFFGQDEVDQWIIILDSGGVIRKVYHQMLLFEGPLLLNSRDLFKNRANTLMVARSIVEHFI